MAQVCEQLPRKHHRALTTIATMLTKMEKKGVVAHRSEGRQFIYYPEVSEADVHRTMVADLTDRWGAIDGALHAIAFAPEDALGGNFLNFRSIVGRNNDRKCRQRRFQQGTKGK